MRILETIIGILLSPFIWIYDRLLKGNPSSPPEYWLFIKELRERGVNAQLQMQNLQIEGISKSAIVVIDPNPHTSKLVNLFTCDSVGTAKGKLAELHGNPLMSHGKQRDCYLMSVSFVVPSDQLAATVTEAFAAFELPPNLLINTNTEERRAG